MAVLKQHFNFASLLLILCMFASGACGIILEYIQASLASMIFGNSFEQWAMVIGLMLFWMGFGSLIQSRIHKRYLILTFVLVEMGLALVGGFSPVVTYMAFSKTAHYSLVLYFFVSFIGIMIGLEIPVLIRINNDFSKELSTNLGSILSADYLGSLIGSLIYVFILLRFTPITQAAFITANANFLLALITFVYFRKKKLIHGNIVLPVMMVCIFCLLTGALVYHRDLDLKLTQPLYDDPVVYSKTGRYQHIAITHYKPLDDIRLFLNGNLQLSSVDESRYHESMVHPAMNLAPVHSRVLILGGGDGCALREVLKYKSVREVVLVDLDPEMTRLAASHPLLTRINNHAFKDARLITLSGQGTADGGHRSIYMDQPGRSGNRTAWQGQKIGVVQYMNVDADQFLNRVTDSFDIIIIDMPDPSTPELVKLYSREFYGKVRRHLSQHGMAVVQATSPYLAKESFLCIGRTLESAGFTALPFHENVPSFGDWGWYLVWHKNLKREKVLEKIKHLEITADTRFLTPQVFRRQLVFGKNALDSASPYVNTLLNPVLLGIYNHESWLLD